MNNHLQEVAETALREAMPPPMMKIKDGYGRAVLNDVEKVVIKLFLERSRGNQVRAARLMGWNRNTLRKRIVAHGINAKKYAPQMPAQSNLDVKQAKVQEACKAYSKAKGWQ